jgi:cysteine desulfuration protein SufE
MPFDKMIRRFQSADKNTRLEAILDASRKLPELPERLRVDGERERHRVTECQTPVYLWFEREGDAIRFYAEVPRESPTVRGFVSLLARALDGQPPSAFAGIPNDLLHELGLDEALGMMRTQGLTAIVQRVKRAAEKAATGG